jgi:hypothetical protein
VRSIGLSSLSKKTKLILKQSLGLTPVEIRDYLANFTCDGAFSCEDEEFISFCAAVRRLDWPVMPAEWLPLNFNVDGVPVDIVKDEYLIYFINRFSGKPAFADIESHFHKLCLVYWSTDARNKETSYRTFMNAGWWPCGSTESILSSKYSKDEGVQVILEFRLFWSDAGGDFYDWNEKLLTWAMNGKR